MDTNYSQPRVSVLLPVHRVDKYFPIAVDSILGQNFHDFELLIIANSCTDDDFHIIENLYAKNTTIRIIRTHVKSLPFALNLGVHFSRGIYIARMDSDDISDITRLKKQTEILDQNQRIGVVSSSYYYIDDNSEIIGTAQFDGLAHKKIKELLPYFCCIAHPTVMLRKKILTQLGGYSFGQYSEDYDLWLRIQRNMPDIEFLCLEEKLLQYRRHRLQATSSNNLNTIRIYNFALKLREFLLTKKFAFIFGIILPARFIIKFKLT